MPSKTRSEVSRSRWLIAQEQERKSQESTEDMKEWLHMRRLTWPRLLDSLKGDITFGNSKRILDIGSGPTSIFLALREGERYAVEPTWERLFQLHPFIKEVEEYKGVNFISCLIEEAVFDKQFDLIFMINVLDHVGELKPVVDKIDELLAPSGNLVVSVDCYADTTIKNIISFFDVDLPHLHHFVAEDIIRLFSSYKLIKQDNKIWQVFSKPPFRGQSGEIPIYRVDRFIARMGHHLRNSGRKGDIFFASKFLLCYSLAILLASLRRREKPIHPLKKARLFIFQKQ